MEGKKTTREALMSSQDNSIFKINHGPAFTAMQQFCTDENLRHILIKEGMLNPTDADIAQARNQVFSAYWETTQMGEETVNKEIQKQLKLLKKASTDETKEENTPTAISEAVDKLSDEVLHLQIILKQQTKQAGSMKQRREIATSQKFASQVEDFISEITKLGPLVKPILNDAKKSAAIQEGIQKGFAKSIAKVSKRSMQKCFNPTCPKKAETLKKINNCPCLKASYCSKECQTADWPAHRKAVTHPKRK
jgi:hypothetical protein